MNNNSSPNTSVDSILGQYAFNEQSSTTELIEFTLKSLRDLLPLTGFKIIKSGKARYVASLSEVQKQQYDEAIIKFQEDGNSPIKRGEIGHI